MADAALKRLETLLQTGLEELARLAALEYKVLLHVYIYIYIYTRIYMYIHTHTHIYIYIYVHFFRLCTYIFTDTYTYADYVSTYCLFLAFTTYSNILYMEFSMTYLVYSTDPPRPLPRAWKQCSAVTY